MSAQAQKFGGFEKKLSLGVRSPWWERSRLITAHKMKKTFVQAIQKAALGQASCFFYRNSLRIQMKFPSPTRSLRYFSTFQVEILFQDLDGIEILQEFQKEFWWEKQSTFPYIKWSNHDDY